MKDLLVDTLKLAPGFVADLLRLITAPRSFLIERATATDASLVQPLLFLGLCFLLSFAITLPWSSGDPLRELATEAVFVYTYVLLYGYVLFLAWRLLGATAPVQQFFIVTAYVAGVLKLLQSATFLVAVGVLRAGDPAGYEEMMSAIGAGDVLWFARNVNRLIELTAWQIFMAAGVLGSAVMVGWVLLNWGAYRTLAGFSRARSAAALLLFVIGAVPVFVVVTLFATALISLER